MLQRIEISAVQSLIDALRKLNYKVIGPTQRNGSIVYEEITSANQLPQGWGAEQRPGFYRLRKRDDAAMFGYSVGPHSWKKFLFAPELTLFSAFRHSKSFSLSNPGDGEKSRKAEKLAFLGVRSCELRAIEIQDKVFDGQQYHDPHYLQVREQLFVVAVNCSSPSETCFCSSMDTGPNISKPFDLALTEICHADDHYFVVESGSQRGENLLQGLKHRPATTQEVAQGEAVIERARSLIKRKLDTRGIKELLYQNVDHPEWEKVGDRCLSCTNCTMVCPTCFCNTIEDSTDLAGSEAVRTRKWDSCFTMDFSYIHGGSIRSSTKARYRQWMTHKLASWIDQFGVSGCVGCGRCITWCPVGIDITDEARVIRETNNGALFHVEKEINHGIP